MVEQVPLSQLFAGTDDDRALPVPPLRLRRILLLGVGPDGARFDPLDLDFATPDGAASRVLLSLTNTGGKSTLITLVSSLVVPASREQIGGKNLGDYVLTGDTSHIVCEWEDAATGTRIVTGTVMEWKDGRRQPPYKQRSLTGMRRSWYLFRTGPDLPGVADLPYVVDGRRANYERYLQLLDDLLSRAPDTRWAHTMIQREWNDLLEERTSIDPVLFGYQMRMNDSEAGAEQLLATFDSPDHVVRFFVAALNDDRAIADFTKELGAYARVAAERPELEALRGFCDEAGPQVAEIVSRSQTLHGARTEVLRTRVAGADHAAAVMLRRAEDQRQLDILQSRIDTATTRWEQAENAYNQISDIRRQLRLEQARAELAAAKRHLAGCDERAARSAQAAEDWEAVSAVKDVAQARARVTAAEAAYRTADSGLEPLRAKVDLAAARLSARLTGLIAEAESAAGQAYERAAAGRRAANAATGKEKEAAAQRAGAVAELSAIRDHIKAAETAIASAIGVGWLERDESASDCQARWELTRDAEKRRSTDKAIKAREAEHAADNIAAELDEVADRVADLATRVDRAQRALDEATGEFTKLRADETIVALIGSQPETFADIADVPGLAEGAAVAADGRAHQEESIAREAQDELARLDETGTSPAGRDALTVLDFLLSEGIGAVTGLQWIEHNVPDPQRRQDFIDALPAVAGGVVVSDGRRFDDAMTHLAERPPHTRTPVTVSTPLHQWDAGSGQPESRFVVRPHRATWDREWAARYRVELDQTARVAGTAASEHRRAAESYRVATANCTAFIRRWSGTELEQLSDAVGQAKSELAAAVQHRENLQARHREQRDVAANAHAAATDAQEAAATADHNASSARELGTVVGRAADAEHRRSAVELAIRNADEAEAAAQGARETAEQITRAAEVEAAQARASIEPWRRERGELGVDEPISDPGGDLDAARTSWRTLRDELNSAEHGMTEAVALEQAKSWLGERVNRAERYAPETLRRAEPLAETALASSQESLAGEQRRARDLARRTEKERLAAEQNLATAEAHQREAQPTGRLSHIELDNVPDWRPDSPEQIPALLERLEERNTDLLREREEAEHIKKTAAACHAEIAGDVQRFEDVVQLWGADTPGTASAPYQGSATTARTTMRTLVEALRKAEQAQQTAVDLQRRAVNQVRATAHGQRWQALTTPLAIRLRTLTESDLIAEAELLRQRIAAMARSAADDLSNMDKHREILRNTLVSLCRDQRRLLREVSRTSSLPPGLGDLSDRPAIKIRFEEASEVESLARLADRIDTWAQELAGKPRRADSPDIRARWLADAVRDTVKDRARVGAWSIEVLKPRIDGDVVYCPPERIPHEFSGGQVLTLAVLVYCALSGVRSAHRTGGSRPPGTLLLDNPFGAASAEALIQMQHRLAAHTGLQLVCATGIGDPEVENAFTGRGSVIVKLRNDGDVRRNLRYLRLREQFVDGIDVAAALRRDRADADLRNWVDATRYELR